MKTTTKIATIIAGWMFLQTSIFGDSTTTTTPTPFSSDSIVTAINTQGTNITNSVNSSTNSINQYLNTLFNDTFIGTFNGTTITSPSALDTKINLLVQNFYSWFTSQYFSGLDFSNVTSTINNKPVNIDDLLGNPSNVASTRNLLAQEVGYDLQRNYSQQLKDTLTLAAQPLEAGGNNIDADSTNILGLTSAYTPYGSMDDHAPSNSNLPTVLDLIGIDSYANDAAKNRAKLYINHILQSAPPPVNFYIPDPSTATNNNLSIYLPQPSNNLPYTLVSVSTQQNVTLPDGTLSSEYQQMLNYLNTDTQYYLPYKLRLRTASILRTLYTESMRQAYQERIPDTTGDKNSLVQREKTFAFTGLDKTYYDNLKNKSLADINLETLQALHTIGYFLHKLDQRIELTNIILSTGAMQQGLQDIQNQRQYINPISTLIKNRCWKVTDASDPNFKICSNPLTPSV